MYNYTGYASEYLTKTQIKVADIRPTLQKIERQK